MSVSQFFVLSARGDAILLRDFRYDVPRSTTEDFFRAIKSWSNELSTQAPPVFLLDGVNYFFLHLNGLYFVFTSRDQHSASFVLELLQRISRVFKDYLGILTEESVRMNFALLYELIDEMIVRVFWLQPS